MRASVCTFMLAVLISLGAGCATTVSDISTSTADLGGNWSVARPGREVITGQVESLGQGLYRFSNMYNLSGVYEVWKNMLVIKEPVHQNFTDLAWRIDSPNRLVVILSPPVAVVGTDYTGVVAEKQ